MVMQVRRTMTVGATPALSEGQLSVGMADQPPTAWVGVPVSVNPAGVIPITGLVRTVAGAPQPAGALGQLWWDEDAAQLFVYTGNQWVVAVNPPIPDTSNLASKDWVLQQIEGPDIYSGPTAPTPPNQDGDLWFDTTTNELKVYSSGAWILATQPLTGFLPLTGGTLSGPLNISNGSARCINVSGSIGATGNLITNGQLVAASASIAGNITANGALTATAGLYTSGSVNAVTGGVFGGWGINTTIGGGSFVSFYWNNTNLFVAIDGSGNWMQLTNQSDERFKQEIAPSTFDCLKTAIEIPLHQFRWKADKPKEIEPIGLIAQRVREVEPCLVNEGMGIDINNMFAVLLGAVQQLTARVAELEAR